MTLAASLLSGKRMILVCAGMAFVGASESFAQPQPRLPPTSAPELPAATIEELAKVPCEVSEKLETKVAKAQSDQPSPSAAAQRTNTPGLARSSAALGRTANPAATPDRARTPAKPSRTRPPPTVFTYHMASRLPIEFAASLWLARLRRRSRSLQGDRAKQPDERPDGDGRQCKQGEQRPSGRRPKAGLFNSVGLAERRDTEYHGGDEGDRFA
jgi:hypothetical protein